MNPIIIYTGVLLVIGISILIFYYYYYLPSYTNANTYGILLLTGPTKFDERFQQINQLSALVSPRQTFYIPYLGYGLTLAWQMYIPVLPGNSEWATSFNKVKPIITINDSPQIGYNPKTNNMSIVVKYRDSPFLANFAELNYNHVKCQTWVKYAVTISSNSIILYENGQIVKTKQLDSVPVIYDVGSQVRLGQAGNNCLARFQNIYMYPYALSYEEVLNI